MILREYLYVDTTLVRGVLAQLDAGIVETETQSVSKDKKSSAGFKGFVEHAQNWGDDRTTTKAMGDAVFPQLEEILESEGLLEDVSDVVNQDGSWTGEQMKTTLPPGKIVRITAPGYLIDARFIAGILSGFATTHRGLVNMGVLGESTEAVLPPKVKKNLPTLKYKQLPDEAQSLEGGIPLGRMKFDDDDETDFTLTGEFFRGITQVTRGMFAPGLHLSLAPESANAGAISVRLQEGRQYLDMDPDILFAHYGVDTQDWTVVGTVGHHPLPDPDMAVSDFQDGSGKIRRGAFGRYVNQLGTMLANLGFTDLPQAPGFSVIPWAVYRTLGSPESIPGPASEAGEAG